MSVEVREVAIEGREKLWLWFELSYASFLTVPRVLMHAMPDEWQGKMADLLNEYDNTFSNWPNGWGSRVQLTEHGKLIATPEWLKDYRHPNYEAINQIRSKTDEI